MLKSFWSWLVMCEKAICKLHYNTAHCMYSLGERKLITADIGWPCAATQRWCFSFFSQGCLCIPDHISPSMLEAHLCQAASLSITESKTTMFVISSSTETRKFCMSFCCMVGNVVYGAFWLWFVDSRVETNQVVSMSLQKQNKIWKGYWILYLLRTSPVPVCLPIHSKTI